MSGHTLDPRKIAETEEIWVHGTHPALEMAQGEVTTAGAVACQDRRRVCLGCAVEELMRAYLIGGDFSVTAAKTLMFDAVPCTVCKIRAAPFEVL